MGCSLNLMRGLESPKKEPRKSVIAVILLALVYAIYVGISQTPTNRRAPQLYADKLGFDSVYYTDINKDNFEAKISRIDIENATAVFNSVNSVLDAVAGTLQPNGVSIYTGYIPNGTFFYHAGFFAEQGIPEGPEWAAFQWEYSYDFGSHRTIIRPGEPVFGPLQMKVDKDLETPFKSLRIPGKDGPRGHLFTFQNVKPLNKVIVMEGASAKKADDGTMDTHNVLARDNTTEYFRNERRLARKICEWGESIGGLDGIVRMETGFEIILCDFHSDKLKLVYNDTFLDDDELLQFPEPLPLNESLGHLEKEADRSLILDDARYKLFNELRKKIAWNNLIRHYEKEERIKVDFRGFITALNKTYLSKDTYTRRLINTPWEVREGFIHSLEKIFVNCADDINYWDGNDWQVYTRHIISKFHPTLIELNDTYSRFFETEDPVQFTVDLTKATHQYYARYQQFDIDQESREKYAVKHAIWEYSAPKKAIQSEGDVLIWSLIAKVVEYLIEEIFAHYHLAQQSSQALFMENGSFNPEKVNEGYRALQSMFEMLDWTVNTGCKEKCGSSQVCYIPVWGPNPFWRDLKEEKGRYTDENGVSRTKKECECLGLSDIVGNADFSGLY